MPYPILFSIGGLHFYSYGFFIALGFLAGYLVVAKIFGRKDYFIFDLLFMSFVGGLLGSRLAHLIFYPSQYEGISFLTSLAGGGFVFYPGLLLGLLIFFRLVRNRGENFLYFLDRATFGLLAAMVIGKFGQFLNEADVGKISKLPWDGNWQHPVAIYQMVWLGALTIIFGLMFFRRRLVQGEVFWLGLIAYGLAEFIFGFWTTQPSLLLGLSSGQLVNLVISIAIFAFWLPRRIKIPQWRKNAR